MIEVGRAALAFVLWQVLWVEVVLSCGLTLLVKLLAWLVPRLDAVDVAITENQLRRARALRPYVWGGDA